MSRPVIFLCSPRAGGNSDTAALAFAHGAGESGTAEPEIIRLREHRVWPCTGCGVCATGKGCALDTKPDDSARALLARLADAPWVCFASPIYFYHLPAHFKALIDRSQAWWERREAGDPQVMSLPMRPAYTLLVGARAKGGQLFAGSLLTFKYFLYPFNLSVTEPMTIYGKDGPQDMAGDEATLAASRELGRKAGGGGFPRPM